MLQRKAGVVFFVLLISAVSQAKDQPAKVIVWPSAEKPFVRFNFGKFKQIGFFNGERNYNIDVTAENLWSKRSSRRTSHFMFSTRPKPESEMDGCRSAICAQERL
jgi:hypothetical protein